MEQREMEGGIERTALLPEHTIKVRFVYSTEEIVGLPSEHKKRIL